MSWCAVYKRAASEGSQKKDSNQQANVFHSNNLQRVKGYPSRLSIIQLAAGK
jgi:hypothetical protein